jgi:hypothetical protein
VGSRPPLLITKKGYTRLAAASDKVYQLLAHGRWVSLGTPTSSTIKTGSRDITEILLKVASNTNQIKSNQNNGIKNIVLSFMATMTMVTILKM